MLQGYAWETCAHVSHDIKLTLFSSLLVSWCRLTFNSFMQHGKFPKPWKVAQNQTVLIAADVLVVWRSWLSNCYRNTSAIFKHRFPLSKKIHCVTCHIEAIRLNFTYSRPAGCMDTTSLDILPLQYLLSVSFIARCPRGEFKSFTKLLSLPPFLEPIGSLLTKRWTRLRCWVKRDQLDATCFIITLFSAQHVSDVNTREFKK